MNRRLLVLYAVMLCWQTPGAWAQHGHGHGGHSHSHGHGHGSHISGHSHGSIHGHYGGDGHYGGHGHGIGHVDIHFGHHFVLPHISHHHHGSYWVDSGLYYYQPRTIVTAPGVYVASKPTAIEFGGYAHVDDLTGRLSLLANDLCLDMHYNYQHNPGFADVYGEAYQIFDLAKSMQSLSESGDRVELVRLVQDLDPLFHHVQGEVATWSRRHQRQIGQSGLLTKIEVMESLLHHLMYDVGVQPHSDPTSEVAPPPATLEVAPPPQSAHISTPPPSLP